MQLDGKNPLLRGFFTTFNVPTRLKVTGWADEFRMLPSKGAAAPGKYRSERTPYMVEPMDALSVMSQVEEVVIVAGAQLGKALDLATRLPTPSGWTTMGQVQVGDELFDQDGRPCRVIAKSPVFTGHRCFEVEFSDGTKIVADAGHRWETISGSRAKRSVVTTEEIAGSLMLRGNRFNHAIDLAGPLQCRTKSLPIDPYVLGVWLGDGNRASAQVTAHEDDAREIAHGIVRGGHRVLIRSKGEAKAKNLMIDPVVVGPRYCKRLHDKHAVGTIGRGRCAECHRQRSNVNQGGNRKPMDPVRIKRDSLALRLRALGLHLEKRIPDEYLRASANQRELLLRGLMDTDGTCCKQSGSMSFCTASQGLAGQMMELCRSLGFKPTMKRLKRANAWVVSFMGYREDIQAFELRRKVGRMRSINDPRSRPTETKRRRIVACTEVDSVPVQCISVDSERHLFLAGEGMIPTHNSESGNNWVGYVIDNAPGPMLLVQPTVDGAKRYSKQRIGPMIAESPTLAAKVIENKSREGGNTMLEKEFPNGILIMGGANSAAGLRSMPVRFLFADEISNWPADVDGEGDPLDLALERTNSFGRKRKVLLTSTPGLDGVCRITQWYLKTDQRKYHVPCPHCGSLHVLSWGNFVIPEDEDGRPQPHKAHMVCPDCDGRIQEHHKTDMLRGGVWIATAPQNADPTRVGYHISGLYSPVGWKSWAKIARQWLEAQGNPTKLKAFTNNVLAEAYRVDGEKIDHTGLAARAEDYGTQVLPAGALLITNGVDVQPDRLELETVAWGLGEESWSIDYKVFLGDPDGPLVWQLLDAYMATEFNHPTGVRLRAARTFIDTGGANTKAVYAYVESRGGMGVFGIKGRGGDGIPAVGSPTRGNMAKIPLIPLGTFALKDAVYGALSVAEPGPGHCHFPSRYGESYFKGLTAEEVRTKTNTKGFPVREWFKVHPRNEPLDCRVYATGAMLSLQVNFEHLHAAIHGAAEQSSERQVRGELVPAA